MQDILDQLRVDNKSRAAWFQLLIIFGYFLVGFFVAGMFQLAIVAIFVFAGGGGLEEIRLILESPEGNMSDRWSLLIAQGVSSLILFVGVPAFYLSLNLRRKLSSVMQFDRKLMPYLLVGVGMVCFMMVNAAVVVWNQSLQMPEFLSGFEQMARSKEDELARLTEFLVDFDGAVQFLFGILVIAVIPGIGEELLFRGVIQNLLHKATGKGHLAIWITAFLFSAFHLQFYGLVPRMLLGALFGYIYWWSGRLSLAMFAHFVNNAVSLILVYTYSEALTGYNPDGPESIPSIPVILVCLVLGVLMMRYLIKYYKQANGLEDRLQE